MRFTPGEQPFRQSKSGLRGTRACVPGRHRRRRRSPQQLSPMESPAYSRRRHRDEQGVPDVEICSAHRNRTPCAEPTSRERTQQRGNRQV